MLNVFAEAPSTASLTIALYLLSYLFVSVLLALVLWLSPALVAGGWTDPFLMTALAPSRSWKLLLVFTLCSMAALPPFYGFIFKVGILSFLASTGAWGLLSLIVLLLMLSWYAYQSMIFRVMTAGTAHKALTKTPQTSAMLLTLTLLLALGVSFVFVDDFFFLAAWMLF